VGKRWTGLGRCGLVVDPGVNVGERILVEVVCDANWLKNVAASSRRSGLRAQCCGVGRRARIGAVGPAILLHDAFVRDEPGSTAVRRPSVDADVVSR